MAWTPGRVIAGVATGGLSEVARTMGNEAAQPYYKASQGVQGLGGQTQAFSQEQWDRQMQGLRGAQGAMQPSSDWFNASYGSQGPGAMENAWQNYGSSNQGPTRTGAASDAYSQYMQGSPMTYGAMNRAAGLAGGQVDYGQYQSQLNGQGQAGQQYGQYQDAYNQGGAAENYYAQNANNFNRQTNSQGVYDNFSSQLYGPGRAESFQVQGPNWGATDASLGAAGRAAEAAQGTTRLEGAQGNEAGNYYRSANNVNQFSQSAMPSLQNQGVYEQFVQSDIMGRNPALEMERQEGSAALNQELARRGHFNSGGAGQAFGKFEGTLAAKSYENRANRAQQAQGMELARIGQGTQTAQAASGEAMGQAAGLQGLAGQQDAQRLDRQKFDADVMLKTAEQNIAQQGMGLQAQNLSMQAAQNADNSRNNRLNTLQGMASAGDSAWNSQQQLGMNAANQAQSQQLARLQGGMSAGNMADQQAYQRAMGQFNMGSQANDQNLQRAQLQWQMGQGADANDLARYGMQGQLGNMADTQKQNAYVNYMNAANQSQGAQDGRMRDAMGARFGIDHANQGQYGQFYGQGGQLSGQSFQDAMNMYANAYGLNAQGGAANAQMPFQMANTFIGGAGMFAGVPPGGGGGYRPTQMGGSGAGNGVMRPTLF